MKTALITGAAQGVGLVTASLLGQLGFSLILVDLQPLHAKIGQLTLENDFLERALTKAGLLSAKR